MNEIPISAVRVPVIARAEQPAFDPLGGGPGHRESINLTILAGLAQPRTHREREARP